MKDGAIKVGVVTDQLGPLPVMGIANANVARMVSTPRAGLLGRQIDLYLEDSATTDSVAEAKAAKLVEQGQGRRHPRRDLQLGPAGDQSRVR